MSKPDYSAVEALEPQPVWHFFAGMSAHPRPSKQEEAVRQWVLNIAKEHGFISRVDVVGNVVIEVPASPGHEDAPLIVLQGHLDMVTEANRDSTHDFTRDPIELIIDTWAEDGRQIVRANGTTLGADNGIGVSLALAAATDPTVTHGPLELLLTIDEEMGMTGAGELEPGFFRGRRMINLDTEEDNTLYIGCAGGMDTTLTWDLPTSELTPGHQTYQIEVGGMRGGHSGGDIHQNRGNAIKTLTRLLREVPGEVRLVTMQGGSKRNAIPREAVATISCSAQTIATLKRHAKTLATTVAAESYEPGTHITITQAKATAAIAQSATDRIIKALAAVPSGVVGMHPKVENLVQTSNNLSTIEPTATDKGLKLVVGLLSRGSTRSLLHAVADQLDSIGTLAGARVQQYGEYPGWEPNPDSELLAICKSTYTDLFEESPEILAVHAGLECGIIGERVGGLDAISFGPDIRGAHSPTERVYVKSVQKSWRLLKAVLKKLATP